MKQLNDIICESRDMKLSASALKTHKSDIDTYMKRVKNMPDDVRLLTLLLQKYNIYTKQAINTIMSGNKSTVKTLFVDFGVNKTDADEIQALFKRLIKEGRVRLVPMLMSKTEREDYLSGTKDADDIMLDLETDRGRTKIARDKMKVVSQIADKYVGKSPLSKTDLISAGTEALWNAILSYRRPETSDVDVMNLTDEERQEVSKAKRNSFDKYVYWYILVNIRSEIRNHSRNVRINSYAYNQNKEEDSSKNFEISIDRMSDDPDDRRSVDRMMSMSQGPDAFSSSGYQDEESVKAIVKRLEERFPLKKCEIFYRIFGINGRQRVKARTIADELGVVEEQISRVKREMISFIKTDNKLKNALKVIADMYTESVLCDIYMLGRDCIFERLISDDNYVLLEDITKFDNKNLFKRTMSDTLSQIGVDGADFIVLCIKKGFDFVDQAWNISSSRNYIIQFLSHLEPTVNYAGRTDAFYLGKMSEIIELCKKHKLYV